MWCAQLDSPKGLKITPSIENDKIEKGRIKIKRVQKTEIPLQFKILLQLKFFKNVYINPVLRKSW